MFFKENWSERVSEGQGDKYRERLTLDTWIHAWFWYFPNCFPPTSHVAAPGTAVVLLFHVDTFLRLSLSPPPLPFPSAPSLHPPLTPRVHLYRIDTFRCALLSRAVTALATIPSWHLPSSAHSLSSCYRCLQTCDLVLVVCLIGAVCCSLNGPIIYIYHWPVKVNVYTGTHVHIPHHSLLGS